MESIINLLIWCSLIIMLVGFAFNLKVNSSNGLIAGISAGIVFFISVVIGFGLLNALIYISLVMMIFAFLSGRKKKSLWPKPIAFISGIIGIAAALTYTVGKLKKPAHVSTQIPEEYINQVALSGGYGLGVYLENKVRSNVLVLIDESSDAADADLFMKGLSQGLNALIYTVEVKKIDVAGLRLKSAPNEIPSPPSSDNDEAPLPSPLAVSIVAIIIENPDCKLVVTNFSLPMEAFVFLNQKIKQLNRSSAPMFALVEPDLAAIDPLIKSKLLMAAIVGNPSVGRFDENTKIPKDLKDIFVNNFLLINPDNWEQIKKDHPELFI